MTNSLNFKKHRLLFLLTPIYFLLAQWILCLVNVYVHSIVAWLFGFKLNPFDIYYGRFSVENIFFLSDADEKVNHYLIYLLGHDKLMAFIAASGTVIGDFGLYLISLMFLNKLEKLERTYLYYFLFWLNISVLSGLVNYIFMRPFSAHGDMGRTIFGLGISPWWIFIGVRVLLGIAISNFLSNTIIIAYQQLLLKHFYSKSLFLLMCLFILFGYSALRVLFTSYGATSHFLALISFLLIPCLFILCCPMPFFINKRLQFKMFCQSYFSKTTKALAKFVASVMDK